MEGEGLKTERSPPSPDPDTGQRLGAAMATALEEGEYHPVILFGTGNSGKTSLLLSLFATLASEPSLQTGLFLSDPVLGSGSGAIGRQLHSEATHTFDVKTQAFIEGEKIPRTALQLPFFIPVVMKPPSGPTARFAFLESNGEWYRPMGGGGKGRLSGETLYQDLREEIEDFVASFQGAITFIYLAPYTQHEVYGERDAGADAGEIQNASLAVAGVIRAYDRIRASHREKDQHLILVTKWDAHSSKSADRVDAIEADPEAVTEFCNRRYSQALAAFRGLGLREDQRALNAYCAGIINERGLLQLRPDDLRSAVLAYPLRLWKWLYANALDAQNLPPASPFPEPPEPPALLKLWSRLLEFVSGR